MGCGMMGKGLLRKVLSRNVVAIVLHYCRFCSIKVHEAIWTYEKKE